MVRLRDDWGEKWGIGSGQDVYFSRVPLLNIPKTHLITANSTMAYNFIFPEISHKLHPC